MYSSVDWLTIVMLVVFTIVYVAVVAFVLKRLWHRNDLSSVERTVWTIGIIVFPVIAAIVWLIGGPHPLGLRLGRDLPIK